MSEVESTKTLRPLNSYTLSIMPDWFSKAIEYWKPEQPPPTTPMRKPAGRGSWVAIISRTLLTALGVIVRGGFLAVSSVGVTLVVVVAMNFPSIIGFAIVFTVSFRGPGYKPRT